MRRGDTAEKFQKLAERIRAARPGMAITSDSIVGFPSETDEDFQKTRDLCEAVSFDKTVVFRYSPRQITPVATKLGGPIDLDKTLLSGQVFHWNRSPDGSWSGLIGDLAVVVSERNGNLVVHRGSAENVARYFALDHPLEEIYAAFPDEPLSQASLADCQGMRILRQPRWECTATFITSSMKQVAHIQSMSLAIRERFGEAVEGSEINAYPAFEVLAKATEPALRDCGLGYRAENLLKTARLLADGTIDLEAIAKQPTARLRETLQILPGVGVKVANCILLFAYERLDAVPIKKAVNEVGLFGNQNSVCQPSTPKWRHTVERLKTHFPKWNAKSV